MKISMKELQIPIIWTVLVLVMTVHVDDLQLAAKDMPKELALLRSQFKVGREDVLREPGDSYVHVGTATTATCRRRRLSTIHGPMDGWRSPLPRRLARQRSR